MGREVGEVGGERRGVCGGCLVWVGGGESGEEEREGGEEGDGGEEGRQGWERRNGMGQSGRREEVGRGGGGEKRRVGRGGEKHFLVSVPMEATLVPPQGRNRYKPML